MLILGLDVAKKTGVCVFNTEKNIIEEASLIELPNYVSVKHLKPLKQLPIDLQKEIKKQILAYHRYSYLQNSLNEIFKKYKIDLVVFEDIYNGRTTATALLYRLSAVVSLSIPEDIQRISVKCNKARKVVTGTAAGAKEAAFRWVIEEFGFTNWDFESYNDITDAIVMALYGVIRFD